MKKMKKLSLLLTAFLLLNFAVKLQAQTTPANQSSNAEWIADNPDADADIKVVRDFLHAIADGDLKIVSNLLADEYKGNGPSPADSTTKEKTISTWKENYNTQKNRKIGFVNTTFRVLQGNLKGDYVSVWGNYGCTVNDKNISFPFQFTAKVTNGKIESSKIYYDNLYIRQALGYTLTPPKKEN
jgi:ketosteroid isomerase-like protein